MEKPIAVSCRDAQRMVSVFEDAGQPLFVAYYRRSLPRFQQVKSWIDGGEIGDVRHIHWTLARTTSPADLAGRKSWRTDPREAPGGYFEDLACHGLDLFDHLLGPIERAHGVSANQQGLYEVPDAVAASWIHAGATGTGIWNFASSKRTDEVRIMGSSGEITFSVFDEAPLILETGSGVRSVEIPNPTPIQLHHVEKMIAHLGGGAAHPSTGHSAARTARVAAAILNSR